MQSQLVTHIMGIYQKPKPVKVKGVMKNPILDGNIKICPKCSSVMHKRRGETVKQWENRIHCNKKCSGYQRTQTDAEIADMFAVKRMTLDQIVKEVGLSRDHISGILRDNGVRQRKQPKRSL